MSVSMTMAKDRRPGWWYPWIFVGGMSVVVVVNAIMMFFAVNTFTGLETEKHYLKGLAYNANLAAAQAQQELGWQTEVTMDDVTVAGETRRGRLGVSFLDAGGNPVEGLTVRAMLIRPTVAGFDSEARLVDGGRGRYDTTVELPAPGQWDVRVLADHGETHFQLVKRIFVP